MAWLGMAWHGMAWQSDSGIINVRLAANASLIQKQTFENTVKQLKLNGYSQLSKTTAHNGAVLVKFKKESTQ